MKVLKCRDIKAVDIEDVIAEIYKNHYDFAEYVANKHNWSIGDTIEAIATHIVYNDEDYIA